MVLRRIEMPDDLEARRLRQPVDGGHVEEEVEAEFRLQPLHETGKRLRREHEYGDPVRDGLFGRRRTQRFVQTVEDALAHGQKSLVTIGWLERAISSCSCMMPSITISGRGGQPGT